MAAKVRAAILFVLAAIVASSTAFASIPQSTALDAQPIDAAAIASDESLPLLSAHDYDAFMPLKGVYDEVARLEKTRVWASRISVPIPRQEERELRLTLRRGYEGRSWKNAEGVVDQGFDDPVVVLTPETTYYPIVDEAGTGSVTAIAGVDGSLVERMLYADSYGEAPRYQQGPVADRITLTTAKDSDGNLEQVEVRVHLSDAVDPATLATGARLATVRADHTLTQLTTVAPELEDERTILWTLTASDWTALATAAEATKLEVSLTSALRTFAWGSTPAAALPTWTRTLYPAADSTSAQPVIYRESLAAITGADAGSRTLLAIPNLYLAASEESKTKLFTGWKAAPFVDPATELSLFRDRWLDSSTGTWLSPDRVGYGDSSNLYAFCAADPINCSDPDGFARRTANGGINHLGDISKHWKGDTWWSRGTGVVLDTLGNTVSDLLMLDAWADANVIAWDSSRSGSERVWAAGKGVGIAALNLFGGEIAGTAGKVLLKVPGAKTVVGKVANSAVGRVLASDVTVLANGSLDRLLGNSIDDLVRSAPINEGFDSLRALDVLERDVATGLDQAVFYSGRRGANRAAAEAFSEATGRLTLEATPGGMMLEVANPPWNAGGREAWHNLSRRYAAGASGEVHAWVGGSAVDSVWRTTELPTLLANTNVRTIVMHDSLLPGRTRYIFKHWSH